MGSIFSLWSDLVEKCSTVFGAHIGSSSITRWIANLPSQSELQVWQHNDRARRAVKTVSTKEQLEFEKAGPGKTDRRPE
jgi:predicted LPLAT superfamily acyltransferase